jgi:hypothetical protein
MSFTELKSCPTTSLIQHTPASSPRPSPISHHVPYSKDQGHRAPYRVCEKASGLVEEASSKEVRPSPRHSSTSSSGISSAGAAKRLPYRTYGASSSPSTLSDLRANMVALYSSKKGRCQLAAVALLAGELTQYTGKVNTDNGQCPRMHAQQSSLEKLSLVSQSHSTHRTAMRGPIRQPPV